MLRGKRVSIIGGGNMGEVLTKGITSGNLVPAEDIMLADIDLDRLNQLHTKYNIKVTDSNKEAVNRADILILAVKPQNMKEVLDNISEAIDQPKIVVSIAAGISLDFIERNLPDGIHVIRVMPNTPALIGEGATALARGKNAAEEDLEIVRRIFDAIGITVIIKEDLMDAVTGLSGSGPAYVFIMIEAMADAGVNMGLSRDVALKLSAQTLLGAARLFLQGEKHPAQLKDMVTSPGGTTIAGIKALEDGKIRATLMAAVEAATLRSKELGRSQ